jgi:hypothetical protein
MNVRTNPSGSNRASSGRLKCAAGASLVMVLSLATLVSSTTPSFASTHVKFADGSTYCKLLTSYDKKQTAANKALDTPGAAAAAIQKAFKDLKAEEGTVLGIAPSVLQAPYKLLFKDLGSLFTDLSAAHYNYAKLTKAQIAKFEALSKTMAPAAAKITAYDKNVCGVKG